MLDVSFYRGVSEVAEPDLGLGGTTSGQVSGAFRGRETCRRAAGVGQVQAVVIIIHLVRRLNKKKSNGKWLRARFWRVWTS